MKFCKAILSILWLEINFAPLNK